MSSWQALWPWGRFLVPTGSEARCGEPLGSLARFLEPNGFEVRYGEPLASSVRFWVLVVSWVPILALTGKRRSSQRTGLGP